MPACPRPLLQVTLALVLLTSTCIATIAWRLTYTGLASVAQLNTDNPCRADTASGSTGGFQWMAYLNNYQHLLQPPTNLNYSESAARQHYDAVGRQGGWVAREIDVRLRYVATGGLTNQLFSHLSAFLLAQELGAQLVLAPALSRTRFGSKKNVMWPVRGIDTIFDVAKMTSYWQTRGLVLHKASTQIDEQLAGPNSYARPTNRPPSSTRQSW